MAYRSLSNNKVLLLSAVPACAIILTYFWYNHRQRKRRILNVSAVHNFIINSAEQQTSAILAESETNYIVDLSELTNPSVHESKTSDLNSCATCTSDCKTSDRNTKQIVMANEHQGSEASDILPSSNYQGRTELEDYLTNHLTRQENHSEAMMDNMMEYLVALKVSDSVESVLMKNVNMDAASVEMSDALSEETEIGTSDEGSCDNVISSDEDSSEDGKVDMEMTTLNVLPTLEAHDSATNSPGDNMLASPCMSTYSDKNSQHSSDSGKGGSDIVKPIAQKPPTEEIPEQQNITLLYQFALQQYLIGKIIGHQGKVIRRIMNTSDTNIIVKKHHSNKKFKVVNIEGSCSEAIDYALELIQEIFPYGQFPEVSLELCQPHSQPIALIPGSERLFLVEELDNDVSLCSIVSASHVFLQQPTHPTHRSLDTLYNTLQQYYTYSNTPPLVTTLIIKGLVCVAFVDGWHRCEVTDLYEEECQVRLVDYGGYAWLPKSTLRQIRYDLLPLPFQAAECYLDNILPLTSTGASNWSEEANDYLFSTCSNQLLKAKITHLSEDNVPYVHLYRQVGEELMNVNQDLVEKGLAVWYNL